MIQVNVCRVEVVVYEWEVRELLRKYDPIHWGQPEKTWTARQTDSDKASKQQPQPHLLPTPSTTSFNFNQPLSAAAVTNRLRRCYKLCRLTD